MITADQIETAKRTAYQQALNDIDENFRRVKKLLGL